MRTSTLLVLLGVGALGVYVWGQRAKSSPAAVPRGTSASEALMMGLEAGIDAGTYNAAALRNQAFDAQLVAAGGTPGIV